MHYDTGIESTSILFAMFYCLSLRVSTSVPFILVYIFLYALNILLKNHCTKKNHCTCCPLHLLFPRRVVLDGDQRSLTPVWLCPFPSTNVGTRSPSRKRAQKRTSLQDGLAQAICGPTLFLQFRVSGSHEPPEPRLSHKGKSWKPVITS